MHEFLANPLTKAVITGLMTAAGVDLHSFFKFKDGNEFIHYNWGTALFHWAQGAVSGLLVGLGYGALIG